MKENKMSNFSLFLRNDSTILLRKGKKTFSIQNESEYLQGITVLSAEFQEGV
jgi:hypothetical protein